tara:strand:- start:1789 stop:2166 length:378 start_codon:yes stop_codon:yes gene_type:complete
MNLMDAYRVISLNFLEKSGLVKGGTVKIIGGWDDTYSPPGMYFNETMDIDKKYSFIGVGDSGELIITCNHFDFFYVPFFRVKVVMPGPALGAPKEKEEIKHSREMVINSLNVCIKEMDNLRELIR